MRRLRRPIVCLLMWSALVAICFFGSNAFIPPTSTADRPVGDMELWTARALVRFGFRNAWTDRVMGLDIILVLDYGGSMSVLDDLE